MKGKIFVSALLAIGACSDGEEDGFEEGVIEQQGVVAAAIHTSDQANAASDGNDPVGTNGFFILQPLVDIQPTTGPFNAGFNGPGRMRAEVRDTACGGDNDSQGQVRLTSAIATQTGATPPRYKAAFSTVGLVANQCYRIVMILDGEILGFRDMHVLSSQSQTPNAGYKKWVLGQNQAVHFHLEGDLDDDDDGVLNHTDNCPADANPGQEDGDSDGTGDACEPAADSDADGIPDGIDNCPGTANPGQENSDGDGAGDACEVCSTDPNKTDPGQCGCGTAETGDTDGDGFHDCNEACDANPFKTAPGACGCDAFDNDSDGDGSTDNCGTCS